MHARAGIEQFTKTHVPDPPTCPLTTTGIIEEEDGTKHRERNGNAAHAVSRT